MKKTLTININGIVFHIDEDAYIKLKNYLDAIIQHFSNKEEGKEVIADIEARIAELFKEKMKDQREVVILEDVIEIIRIMGNPEDFLQEEPATENNKKEKHFYEQKKRRIYRDTDNRVLGGVCAGLGIYFDIDPVIIRIIMLVAFFAMGAGPMIYIILWIAIPKAVTTAQKLEMRGEHVNISNIEKSIKEEFNEVKEGLKKKFGHIDGGGINNIFYKISHLIVTIVSVFVKIFLSFLGIMLIIVGIALLFGIEFPFMFGHHIPFNPLILFTIFVSPTSSFLIKICLILLILIPILSIIFIIFRLLFGLNHINKIFKISAGLVWTLALCFLIVLTIIEINRFKAVSSSTQSIQLKNFKSDTLYLNMNDNFLINKNAFHLNLNQININANDDEFMITGLPHIVVEKGFDNQFELVIRRVARGNEKLDAKQNADKIIYSWMQKDSLITFNHFFTLPADEKYQLQKIEIILKVPSGKTVVMDKKMKEIRNEFIFNEIKFNKNCEMKSDEQEY